MELSYLRIGLRNFRLSFAIIAILITTIPFTYALGADALPNPTLTLVGAVLKLAPDAKSGTATMLLKVDGLDKNKKDYPTNPDILQDIGSPSFPPVDVTFTATGLGAGESSRSWRLSAAIENLPANTSQKRFLLVQYAGLEKTLDYTLTNQYDTAFSWTLKPPPSEISIRAGEGIEIGIAVGPVPASKVGLLQATLIEQSRKYPLAEAGLLLCKNSSGDCISEIDLEANSANRLWLRTKDDAYGVGQFQGSVTIAAEQKPGGDTINLTVYATRLGRQVAGLVVIIIGVAIAWCVSTYARTRLSRNQALLPVAYERGKFDRLQAKLTHAPKQIDRARMKITSEKLTMYLEGLSESELDKNGYLPPADPDPYSGPAPKPDALNAFLQKINGWAVVLEEIVNGMTKAWKELDTYSNQETAVNQAVGEMDKLASPPDAPSLNDLRSGIDKVLDELHDKLNKPKPAPSTDKKVEERSYEMLKLESSRIRASVWFLVGLVVSLVGFYFIVMSNLGFGLWTHYLLCFFWGFGIPTSGQQITQMTGKQVMATLTSVKQP